MSSAHSWTWASLCQTWFSHAGATAQMGGPRMSLTSRWVFLLEQMPILWAVQWHECELPRRTYSFYPHGTCFAPCITVTTLSTELPKNHRDKVLALLGWLCNTQKSEHTELNQSPIINLCLFSENCNSQSRRDVCVQRHTGNYKERLDADSWFQFGTFPTMPLSLLGSLSQTGGVCVKGSFPFSLVPGISR